MVLLHCLEDCFSSCIAVQLLRLIVVSCVRLSQLLRGSRQLWRTFNGPSIAAGSWFGQAEKTWLGCCEHGVGCSVSVCVRACVACWFGRVLAAIISFVGILWLLGLPAWGLSQESTQWGSGSKQMMPSAAVWFSCSSSAQHPSCWGAPCRPCSTDTECDWVHADPLFCEVLHWWLAQSLHSPAAAGYDRQGLCQTCGTLYETEFVFMVHHVCGNLGSVW